MARLFIVPQHPRPHGRRGEERTLNSAASSEVRQRKIKSMGKYSLPRTHSSENKTLAPKARARIARRVSENLVEFPSAERIGERRPDRRGVRLAINGKPPRRDRRWSQPAEEAQAVLVLVRPRTLRRLGTTGIREDGVLRRTNHKIGTASREPLRRWRNHRRATDKHARRLGRTPSVVLSEDSGSAPPALAAQTTSTKYEAYLGSDWRRAPRLSSFLMLTPTVFSCGLILLV